MEVARRSPSTRRSRGTAACWGPSWTSKSCSASFNRKRQPGTHVRPPASAAKRSRVSRIAQASSRVARPIGPRAFCLGRRRFGGAARVSSLVAAAGSRALRLLANLHSAKGATAAARAPCDCGCAGGFSAPTPLRTGRDRRVRRLLLPLSTSAGSYRPALHTRRPERSDAKQKGAICRCPAHGHAGSTTHQADSGADAHDSCDLHRSTLCDRCSRSTGPGSGDRRLSPLAPTQATERAAACSPNPSERKLHARRRPIEREACLVLGADDLKQVSAGAPAQDVTGLPRHVPALTRSATASRHSPRVVASRGSSMAVQSRGARP